MKSRNNNYTVVLLLSSLFPGLEAAYTPRNDMQGISDPKVLARMAAAVGVKTADA